MRPIDIVKLDVGEAVQLARVLHVPQRVPNKLSVNVYSRGPRCNADCGFCAWNRDFTPQKGEGRVTLTPTTIREHLEYAQEHNAVIELMDASIRLTPNSFRLFCSLLAVSPAGINPGICEGTAKLLELKELGAIYYVNNLETSSHLFSELVTSHKQGAKLRSLKAAQLVGLQAHTGFVIGMGEGEHDLMCMIQYVRELRPSALNINFFYPVAGLPMSTRTSRLSPEETLRRLCMFRIALPDTPIYLGAGRSKWLADLLPEGEKIADGLYIRRFLNHEFLTIEE